jgi:hypothetical protein
VPDLTWEFDTGSERSLKKRGAAGVDAVRDEVDNTTTGLHSAGAACWPVDSGRGGRVAGGVGLSRRSRGSAPAPRRTSGQREEADN